jgi:3-oxoacyl-[acyl-carrier protein] reductase
MWTSARNLFAGSGQKQEGSMRLQGRSAIVTGGARGIGKAIATRLAHEGASVVIADVQEETLKKAVDEIATSGGSCLAIRADVTAENDVSELVKKTVSEFGRIDILVNNAGGRINTPPSFEDTTLEQWNSVIAVNLTGAFLCCRAVLPHMKKKRSGRIVNISSKAGRSSGLSTTPAYASAKAGILGLTRQLALEMGPYGININAIAPGFTSSGPQWEKDVWSLVSPERKNVILNASPFGRIAAPEEQASVVAFLCSDDASFITGACIDSNGGAFMA